MGNLIEVWGRAGVDSAGDPEPFVLGIPRFAVLGLGQDLTGPG